MSEFLLDCLRDEVAFRLHRRGRLAAVESELIEPAQGLSEDERSALGLFAWYYAPAASSEASRLMGSSGR
jgi:hypothetical protein